MHVLDLGQMHLKSNVVSAKGTICATWRDLHCPAVTQTTLNSCSLQVKDGGVATDSRAQEMQDKMKTWVCTAQAKGTFTDMVDALAHDVSMQRLESELGTSGR